MRAAAGVVVVVGAAALGALTARADNKKKPGLVDFESWKTPVTRERDAAKQLAPGTLDLTPVVTGIPAPRPMRVRVYADRDYRQTVIRWQTKIRAQIARINRVVEPVFAVRFDVES